MTWEAARRSRREGEQAVTPLELFFDLVFVFGVSQLSHHLLTHLSWRGFAETGVLLLAIFTVWSYTSWETTIASVARASTRTRMLLVMPPGLLMNAAIAQAFGSSGWAFALPYLLIQVGRTLWTRRSSTDPLFRGHFTRTLVWIAGTSPLWVFGALVGSGERLAVWGAAALIDLTGTLLAHPVPGRHLESRNVGFDGEHMLERGRLLFIIALGETVLTAGTALAQAPRTALTALTGSATLSVTVALWFMAFGRTDQFVSRQMQRTRDPLGASLRTINTLPLLLLGLVLLAVAGELTIEHPWTPRPALSLLLFGGPLLVTAAQLLYQGVVVGGLSRVRLGCCTALVIVGLLTWPLGPAISVVIAALLLGVFTLLDLKEEQMEGGTGQGRS